MKRHGIQSMEKLKVTRMKTELGEAHRIGAWKEHKTIPCRALRVKLKCLAFAISHWHHSTGV